MVRQQGEYNEVTWLHYADEIKEMWTFLPRRCSLTGKIILGKGYRVRLIASDSNIYADRWYDLHAYLAFLLRHR